MPKVRLWQPFYFIQHFLYGERQWGGVRLQVMALLAVLYVLVCAMLFERQSLLPKVVSLVNLFPQLEIVPVPILTLSVSLFSWSSLRYLLIPLVGYIFAARGAAAFLQDIYELPTQSHALQYIMGSVFAQGYPVLKVADGKKQIDEDDVNLLDRIGGPGYIRIAPGNVVLFERLNGFSNVLGAGRHFIPRHETIKEIASLEDQHGYIESLSATTKDGIEVIVREIHFRFRLRLGRKAGDYTHRTPENPFPFSVQAVRNMAYNRSVAANGLTPWYNGVKLVVDSVISDYISQHQFDHITTPSYNEKDPRAEIRQQLNAYAIRERLKGLGAELLWCDIGHFESVDHKVTEQRLDTWSARWLGDARVARAYGEARRQANQELGRAEGQSEILLSILHALDEAGLSDDSPQNVLNLILARTAQVLDALSEETEGGHDEQDAKL